MSTDTYGEVFMSWWFITFAVLSIAYLFIWVLTWALAFVSQDWKWGVMIFIMGLIPGLNLFVALPFSIAYLYYRSKMVKFKDKTTNLHNSFFPLRGDIG